MNENILVTGGAGYIGSHTCKVLAKHGFAPVVIDNLQTGHRRNVKWGPFVEGDIRNQPLVADTLRRYQIKSAIHFAASAYVGESMQAPGLYFSNNIGGTLSLLQAMTETGASHLVFSSSCATYGIPTTPIIGENHTQQPVNPYGESKLVGEKMAAWFGHVHGLSTVCLRFFNAAGADPEGELGEEHDPETHLIPLVIGAAIGTSESLKVFGTDHATPDGTCIRDYVHVMDLASAHVQALRNPSLATPWVAFNLGTGRGHSVLEVIRAVEKRAGRPVPVEFIGRRPGDPTALVADSARAQNELGWSPVHSGLANIVNTAIAWHEREPRFVDSRFGSQSGNLSAGRVL